MCASMGKKGGFYELFSEDQKDFIDQIEPLNIEARYPSHKERLLKSLTEAKCNEIFNETKKKLRRQRRQRRQRRKLIRGFMSYMG